MEFAKRIEKNKKDCLDILTRLAKEGRKIYAYGASTKGNTILQYYGIDSNLIEGIAEIHPEKIGKMTVGTHIPIIAEEEAKKKADYFLVLPYAFRDSFIKREQEWLKKGNKFIFCTPEVEVFGYEENKKKKALILGITGQDGSYLAEVLLEKGYEVHGMIRRSSTGNTKNIDQIINKIILHKGDMADVNSLYRIISQVQPEEIYNEADQDHVGWSYDIPAYSYDITAAAVGRILEVIKQVNPKIKFFQPVSATMFGDAIHPQSEKTPFNPQSPYACAKLLAYYLARYYRDVHGMFVSTAIFFNHDSPRRSEEYLLHKICNSAVRISKGKQKQIALGSLDMSVDIGYAKEFMEAAWQIMQQENPDDYVIGTGEGRTIREFLEEAFAQVGLKTEGLVTIDPKFVRPGKQPTLIGDITKAKEAFGFNPKIKFKELIKILIENQLKEKE